MAGRGGGRHALGRFNQQTIVGVGKKFPAGMKFVGRSVLAPAATHGRDVLVLQQQRPERLGKKIPEQKILARPDVPALDEQAVMQFVDGLDRSRREAEAIDFPGRPLALFGRLRFGQQLRRGERPSLCTREIQGLRSAKARCEGAVQHLVEPDQKRLGVALARVMTGFPGLGGLDGLHPKEKMAGLHKIVSDIGLPNQVEYVGHRKGRPGLRFGTAASVLSRRVAPESGILSSETQRSCGLNRSNRRKCRHFFGLSGRFRSRFHVGQNSAGAGSTNPFHDRLLATAVYPTGGLDVSRPVSGMRRPGLCFGSGVTPNSVLSLSMSGVRHKGGIWGAKQRARSKWRSRQ